MQVDINALFFVIGEHTREVLAAPALTFISRALLGALAVVFIITKGIQLYYKEADPRELIVLCLLRIGWAVFLLQTYDTFFYTYLWTGFKTEIAPIFGNIQLLNVMYQIMLGALGALGVGSLLTGGAYFMVGCALFLIIAVAYAGLLLGGLNAVLTAAVYLVSGKLFICLILFDETQGWFFAWLKGYLGALLGIAIWYFVMGAVMDFDYWRTVETQIRTIEDLSRVISHLLNICILVVGTAFISIQAGSLGKNMLG